MIHHSFHPLPLAPFAHLDQWAAPWPDVYAFHKSDARLSRPHPYSSRRRQPYPRLDPTSPRSPRTGVQPVLRTQVPPTLPICTPVLECEFIFVLIIVHCIDAACQHRPCPTPDRRCQRLLRRHLRRGFSRWCATHHYWHPSRFHIDHQPSLTVSNFLTQMRISHAPLTRDQVPSGNAHTHETVRRTLLRLWFQSAAPQKLSSAD